MRKPLSGSVYVAERDGLHKVGFSREHVRRRVRNCGGSLVLEIPCNLPVSALENLIHRRFAQKHVEGPGFKREWFRLNAQDLDWLRGLAAHLSKRRLNQPNS